MMATIKHVWWIDSENWSQQSLLNKGFDEDLGIKSGRSWSLEARQATEVNSRWHCSVFALKWSNEDFLSNDWNHLLIASTASLSTTVQGDDQNFGSVAFFKEEKHEFLLFRNFQTNCTHPVNVPYLGLFRTHSKESHETNKALRLWTGFHQIFHWQRIVTWAHKLTAWTHWGFVLDTILLGKITCIFFLWSSNLEWLMPCWKVQAWPVLQHPKY